MNNGRRQVLVVDDDEDYLELLQTWLQELDLEVCATTSGQQAIALLIEKAFNAMLVDVVMPGLDGLEVIRAARQRYPDMPIVALSGGGKRITAALATSSAVPLRFSGSIWSKLALVRSKPSAPRPRVTQPVATKPGQMQLTRISGASARARLLVMVITAPLEAA